MLHGDDKNSDLRKLMRFCGGEGVLFFAWWVNPGHSLVGYRGILTFRG